MFAVEDPFEAHGRSVSTLVDPGPAIRRLLPAVEERGADLVVMGDSSRSFLSRQIFGDVVLHAIRNAEVPLFLSH